MNTPETQPMPSPEKIMPPPSEIPKEAGESENGIEQGLEQMTEDERRATLISNEQMEKVEKLTEEVSGQDEKIEDIEKKIKAVKKEIDENKKGFFSKMKDIAAKVKSKVFDKPPAHVVARREDKKITRKFKAKDWEDFDLVVSEFRAGGPEAVVDYMKKNEDKMSDQLKKFLNEEWLGQVKGSIEKKPAPTVKEAAKEPGKPAEPTPTTKEPTEPAKEPGEPELEIKEAVEKKRQAEAELSKKETEPKIAEEMRQEIKEKQKEKEGSKEEVRAMIRDAYKEKISDQFLDDIIEEFDLQGEPAAVEDKEKVLEAYNGLLEKKNPIINEQINTVIRAMQAVDKNPDKKQVNKMAHRVRRLLNEWNVADGKDYFKEEDQIKEAYRQIKTGEAEQY